MKNFSEIVIIICIVLSLIFGGVGWGKNVENTRLYNKCLEENKTLTYHDATTLCQRRVER